MPDTNEKSSVPNANQKQSVFSGWNFLSEKGGGANEAGEYGGVYKSTDGQTTALIKKEAAPAKNISEFLGSQIFQAISPDENGANGAKVSLIKPDNLNLDTGKSPDTDSKIYVKSEFIKDYSADMYKDMDKHMDAGTGPSSVFRKDGDRPLFMGTRNAVFKTLNKAFDQLKYQNFEGIMPASLLIGDFDIHIGNIGIIRDPKNPATLPKMVRIDFAGSLDKLTNAIHPHSRLRHLPGFGPTNHFREFPSELRRNNPKFADSLIASSKIDLDSTIDKSFEEMTKYYSNDALAAWAKQAMPKTFNSKKSEEITPEEIKNSFKDVMKKRQESLKEYGLEVKLSTLITKKLTHPYYEINKENKEKLKALIEEHPDHFKKITDYDKGKEGGKKLKLSDKSLRGVLSRKSGAEKHLMNEISQLVKESQNKKLEMSSIATPETKKMLIEELKEYISNELTSQPNLKKVNALYKTSIESPESPKVNNEQSASLAVDGETKEKANSMRNRFTKNSTIGQNSNKYTSRSSPTARRVEQRGTSL